MSGTAVDRLLSEMCGPGPCTRMDLALRLGVSPQRAGVLLRYAHTMGWVRQGERSGRHRCHALTAQGRQRVAEMEAEL